MTENKEPVNTKETPFVGQKAVEELAYDGYNKNVMQISTQKERPEPAQ